MKRKSTLLLALILFLNFNSLLAQPKYIFYLIGDGMGLNHVNLAEIFQSEQQGVVGYQPLVISTFPYVGFASSNSQSHGVTDSSAGGTALAVGKKTKNGVIAMDSTTTIPYKSIAYAAKEKGLKVGIATSVSIDHATPASFYANQPNRSQYYEIALQIPKSNFDFFAGSGFLKPTTTADKKEAQNIHNILEKSGYKIVKGKKAFSNTIYKNQKVVWINDDSKYIESLKFAIDQTPTDLSLEDITTGAIKHLSENNKKGFFLMVEGGKIDWSSHSNDGATTLREMQDFHKTIQLAYEFYKKHPKETLIVVTADHETGGLGIGNGLTKLNTIALHNQKVSQGTLSSMIGELRNTKPNASWEEVKQLISENTGLFKGLKVSKDDESALYKAYEKSFVNHQNETTKTLYANDDKIASLSIKILNKIATLSWGTTNHSAGYIPLYAIGEGAELFNQKMDNTDIPKKIAQAAQLSL